MPGRRRSEPEHVASDRVPAATPMGRENQMISLASSLAEQQLIDGTASAQVITHYLKLGSSREVLEQERLRHENELLQVKRESYASQSRIDDLYREAINAMRSYGGHGAVSKAEDE